MPKDFKSFFALLSISNFTKAWSIQTLILDVICKQIYPGKFADYNHEYFGGGGGGGGEPDGYPIFCQFRLCSNVMESVTIIS